MYLHKKRRTVGNLIQKPVFFYFVNASLTVYHQREAQRSVLAAKTTQQPPSPWLSSSISLRDFSCLTIQRANPLTICNNNISPTDC